MAGWLYAVDRNGLLVTPRFMERLRNGQTAAKRELAKIDLTALYRVGYTKLKVEHMQPGLFWSEEVPPLVRIPLVSARNSPPLWLPDYVTYKSARVTEKDQRFVEKLRGAAGTLYYRLLTRYQNGGVTVLALKPNPKFELVVVNKFDRAALLHLLAALDPGTNVETWLRECTRRSGATRQGVLYDAYEAWCAQRGEARTGTKGFSQALVAAGVAKLKRGKDGERYELELHPLRMTRGG